MNSFSFRHRRLRFGWHVALRQVFHLGQINGKYLFWIFCCFHFRFLSGRCASTSTFSTRIPQLPMAIIINKTEQQRREKKEEI